MLQKEFKYGYYDLNISLFEKCLSNNNYSMLNVQHRMRPEISIYVNKLFYNGKLIDHQRTKEYPNMKGFRNNNNGNNIIFFNHDFIEDNYRYYLGKNNKSKAND